MACVHPAPNACRPCHNHGDCDLGDGNTMVCHPVQDYGACLPYCTPDIDCPSGFVCTNLEGTENAGVCMPESDSCACTSAFSGVSGSCLRTNDYGSCTGSYVCTVDGHSTCDAPEPNAQGCVIEAPNCSEIAQTPMPQEEACALCPGLCALGEGPEWFLPFDLTDENSSGVTTNDEGHIILNSEDVDLSNIWIANSEANTVSKIDTDTGLELARYRVCASPSRTAIDAYGNCWVGCRGGGQITKIAAALLDCVDKNGDGVIQTSVDLDNNGTISGDEILPEGTDECILFTVQPDGGNNARALGIDKDNHAWVGMWDSSRLWQLDEDTGASLQSIDIPTNPYGLAIDQDGIIWISGRGNNTLVRVDPETNETESYTPDIGCFSPYGIAIDEQGRVWTANHGCWHVVYRFDPVTATWAAAETNSSPRGVAADGNGFIYVANDGDSKVAKVHAETMQTVSYADLGGGRNPVGVAVDFSGKVWAVNQGWATATRINPISMGVEFEVSTGAGPYTYSDMTGYAQRTVVAPQGYYKTIFESPNARTSNWDRLELDAYFPPGSETYITVRVRAAETQDGLASASWTQDLGPYPPAALPVDLKGLGLNGGFLDVEVTLHAENDSESPILKSIVAVVAAAGETPEPAP